MEFILNSPILMASVASVIVTLVGVILILRGRKSPGLEVADDFLKEEVEDERRKAAEHKANADSALNDGVTGDDISFDDATRIISGVISDDERRSGSK